jgi:hypothetical protein
MSPKMKVLALPGATGLGDLLKFQFHYIESLMKETCDLTYIDAPLKSRAGAVLGLNLKEDFGIDKEPKIWNYPTFTEQPGESFNIFKWRG